jgi:DNA-binding MarR family transcriptional regulator
VPELPVIAQPPRRSAALLDHLARRMRLRSESALSPLGLRPRHLVALTMLRDCDAITQQGLAEMLQLDGTNVVGLLNELEAEGLATRTRSPEDRRRHIVELTMAGREMLARAEFVLAAVEAEVLDGLSLEQRGLLFDLLRQATAGHQVHPSVECAAGTTATVDA